MPRNNTSQLEEGPTLEQRREWQRKLLENLPKWLRYRGLRQRDIANALGTSEGQISKYFGGKILMSVAVLREMALVLKTHPADLLKPPPEEGLGARMEETLRLMDELTPEQWEAVLNTARAIKSAKGTS